MKLLNSFRVHRFTPSLFAQLYLATASKLPGCGNTLPELYMVKFYCPSLYWNSPKVLVKQFIPRGLSLFTQQNFYEASNNQERITNPKQFRLAVRFFVHGCSVQTGFEEQNQLPLKLYKIKIRFFKMDQTFFNHFIILFLVTQLLRYWTTTTRINT